MKGQCKTEYLNRFLQIVLRGSAETSKLLLPLQASKHLPATALFSLRAFQSPSLLCLALPQLLLEASLSFVFWKEWGFEHLGGGRCFTGTLHGKLVGIWESSLSPLPSKCRLQILEFSLILTCLLILINHWYLRLGSCGRR